jgi:hypothetical protein
MGHVEEAQKFAITSTTTSFSDVTRDRYCCSAHLDRQTEALGVWERRREPVRRHSHRASAARHRQLSGITHWRTLQ